MIATILARWIGAKAAAWLADLLPYILIGAACLGAFLWIHGMQTTIADQKTQIGTLQINLSAEQAARKADVAGLTTLSQGLVAASSAKASDQAALTGTIDVANPPAASPALGAFLACLRDADSGNGKPCAASGTGAAAPGATGSAGAGK
ncbi:hypothetical protein [Sphingomonas oryzagri]|uniref:Uncharacterized protein n=1 Tax=Sphingomonas oryzagri TaxID=3042314 RepID=A0ABT6N136_9SPHN|nr:hypothetical protein [Sphingomonas oryzagri]MDH7638975.1 hypothetical protein [Sphingomonas oryzagri]